MLIVKDAAGNEVFRVNPDGSSVHEGLEHFNGGLVVPVPGVGEISISEFGAIIPLKNGGGLSLDIEGNRFKIAGGTPGMKVSWQVTGVRHDPYARAYRSPVEVQKPAQEQGTYLHPELYGATPPPPFRHAPGAGGP